MPSWLTEPDSNHSLDGNFPPLRENLDPLESLSALRTSNENLGFQNDFPTAQSVLDIREETGATVFQATGYNIDYTFSNTPSSAIRGVGFPFLGAVGAPPAYPAPPAPPAPPATPAPPALLAAAAAAAGGGGGGGEEELQFRCPYRGCPHFLKNWNTLCDHVRNIHGPRFLVTCNYPGCGTTCTSSSRKASGNMKRHRDKEHRGWVSAPGGYCTVRELPNSLKEYRVRYLGRFITVWTGCSSHGIAQRLRDCCSQ
ncbi:hypothetical protein TWF730_007280 [Orbilia blumenaviensis]|uniref:C2H2-type domain-containing protein n=1 Tax=Orbilia blumenaviensis TaxID=1796055 RepID=A0AAV9V822_9PEZI